MRIPRSRLICVSCLLTILVGSLSAQTLQVIDAGGHATTFTAAQITSLPRTSVNVSDHDAPAQFDGVPLSAVLAAAGVQLGDTLRGPRMTEALLAAAADGYKVVFALAEVDPAFAARQIILADKRDGKPLSAREGPFRIVAPGDKRPARWARQVVELRVIAVK